jgi:hypothetical protein
MLFSPHLAKRASRVKAGAPRRLGSDPSTGSVGSIHADDHLAEKWELDHPTAFVAGRAGLESPT